jgi:hypothetical protein
MSETIYLQCNLSLLRLIYCQTIQLIYQSANLSSSEVSRLMSYHRVAVALMDRWGLIFMQ